MSHQCGCGRSYIDGQPDIKVCHEVRVLPGTLTLRERDVMRRLVEVTGASRGRILRRSPPWVTIEADLLAIDHVRDADDANERHGERDEDGD